MDEDLSPESKVVLESNAQFCADFYNQLQTQEGNLLCSPFSVHMVLSMIYQGAESTTAERIAEVLGLPSAPETAKGYFPIIKEINSLEKVSLLSVNKLLIMEEKQLNEGFQNALVTNFVNDVEKVNFEQSSKATKMINNWVQVKTQDKIRNLIAVDELDDDMRLVLINAIYFKGGWAEKFKSHLTTIEDFFITKDQKTTAKMMKTTGMFNYKLCDELESQVIEVPYNCKNLSMIVIIPKEVDGIKKLEIKMAKKTIKNILEKMYKNEVNFSFPKFKLEHKIVLNTILDNMGLSEILDAETADFTGILSENIYVNKAIQKLYMEVSEKGSEISPTASTSRSSSVPRPPREMKVNHPFLFLIVENRNTVLFMGRILNPKY